MRTMFSFRTYRESRNLEDSYIALSTKFARNIFTSWKATTFPPGGQSKTFFEKYFFATIFSSVASTFGPQF